MNKFVCSVLTFARIQFHQTQSIMKKAVLMVALAGISASVAHAQSSAQEQPARSRTAQVKQETVTAAPKVKADAQRIDTRTLNAQPVPATPVRAVNANVESKRLPANYPNADNRTSKSDQ
jgi:hypothetical protein